MRPALVALLCVLPAVADDPKPAPLDAAWRDLLSSDAAAATRAALALSADKGGVAFLAAKLKPVKADRKLLARLVADLGDPDFKTREAAQADLEYFGAFIKGELADALKEAESEEAKARLKKLADAIDTREKLEKLKGDMEKADDPPPVKPGRFGGVGGVSVSTVNGVTRVTINGKVIDPDAKPVVIEKPGPPAAWVRAGRAVGVLEFAGTPEAVKVLEQLALGEDAAPPTKQAQDALARLKRKK